MFKHCIYVTHNNMLLELHNSHFQLFMFSILVAISNLHSDVKKVHEKD